MKENNPHILGTEKVGKLLLEYSIPAIIGMTLTSLYNIIDSVFIGHGVGAMAISGLAISFPLMNLLVAFCTLVGVGGATISSIRLGQKDTDGTTIVKEYPFAYTGAEGEIPYYAILNEENQALYEKYRALTAGMEHFHLLGRLAEYRYYNIDAMVKRAMELADRL
jgi:hypothetical protein